MKARFSLLFEYSKPKKPERRKINRTFQRRKIKRRRKLFDFDKTK